MTEKLQNIGFDMGPMEFDTYLYPKEYLVNRIEWYISQADETDKIANSSDKKKALPLFRRFNDILRKEYHEYSLKRVQTIFSKRSKDEQIMAEYEYYLWVQDVVANQTGRTTLDNLHSRTFDYRDYRIYRDI